MRDSFDQDRKRKEHSRRVRIFGVKEKREVRNM